MVGGKGTVTKIEWCATPQPDGSVVEGRVWNFTRGCNRVSPGCGDGEPGPGGGCYAERQAYRFSGPGQPYEGLVTLGKNGPRWTGTTAFLADKLAEPLSVRAPSRWFVDSMSDAFHDNFTDEQIASAFGIMAAASQHTFLLLTKRAARMAKWYAWLEREARECNGGRGTSAVARCLVEAQKRCDHRALRNTDPIFAQPWPLPNVHLLVSVETQRYADERIPLLLQCPAVVHGVSVEPILGPLDLGAWLPRLQWAILGGEGGPRSRPCPVERIRFLLRQAKSARCPVFVKQLGSAATLNGVELPLKHPRGGDPREWPSDLNVRELPK